MTWLAWRQLRANAFVATVAAALTIAVLALTRAHIARYAGTDQLSTPYESLRLVGTGIIGVPAFIGAFWGAPLVARELEMGTHRLAWTQGVTRTRWLWTRLGLAALVAAFLTAAVSVAFTWWSAPFDELGNRIGTANFGQRGVTPVAYAVFALALGTLSGTVLRRTLPAMAVTLLGFFVARFSFQWVVRNRLIGTVEVTLPNNSFGQRPPGSGGWILSTRTVDASGQALDARQLDHIAASCGLTRGGDEGAVFRCIDRLGVHDIVTWHPASHFWPMQLAESAAFLAMAAAVAFACFWWLRHRTA